MSALREPLHNLCEPGKPIQAADQPDRRDVNLLPALSETRRCLQEAWPDGHPALGSLVNLLERLQNARLQLAVLGQFKRGKSTFINALLGEPYLPAAVVPATAVPTFIAWGPTPLILVIYQDNRPAEEFHPADASDIRERLHQWVTEEGNPLNNRHVARVDLFLPAEILRDGLVLIDTPGIGSTLQHNTDTALQVLPECDAAFFVISADPPITEAETTYLVRVQGHVVRLFFVLNKTDYLSHQEQAEIVLFLQRALPRTGKSDFRNHVFPMSARLALDAVARGDDSALEASGLKRIEREVLQSLARDKVAALHDSVRAKTAMILAQVLSDLSLRTRAFELPLEDLQQRARLLEEALREAQNQRRVAHDLLEGDRRRAVAELENQAERLRLEGRDYLGGVVQRAVAENSGVPEHIRIQQALDAAVPAFFEERLVEISSEFRQLVEMTLAQHHMRADSLVGSVRKTAAALFEVPFRAAEVTEPFRLGPEPYWVTQKWSNVVMLSPVSLMTRLLPASVRRKRLHQQMEMEVSALVQHNVENLRWATLRGLNDTFRRFATQLDERLAEVLAVTQGAISQALERRQTEAGQAGLDLQRLRGFAQRIAQFHTEFAGVPAA